jgi:hypothetical protein
MMRFVSRTSLISALQGWVAKGEAVFTFPLLLWFILGFGITVRCVQYLANRSLWLDESMLALNIIHRTFSQLLQPLDYNQGAPLAFLIIERAAVEIFGKSEYVLRLFPLWSGILSLFLFYKLAKYVLDSMSLMIGVTLFVSSWPLIYYSSEVKQYSSDVTITLMLYCFTLRSLMQNQLSIGSAIIFGIMGFVAVWLSYPSIFVLVGIWIVLMGFYVSRKEWGNMSRLLMASALWALSFAVLYSISLRYLTNNNVLLDYWASSFMPLPPTSLQAIRWFIDRFFAIFEDAVGLTFVGLGSLSFLVGCRPFFRTHTKELFLFLLPVLFALFTSGLKKYPFDGRFLLFVVPSMMIFIAQGSYEIITILRLRDTAIAVAFLVLLIFHPVLFSVYYLAKPYVREEIKPVLNHIRAHYNSGDILYIYPEALPAFRYYQERYGLTDADHVVGHAFSQWDSHLNDLDKISGHKRVWILFSHISTPKSLKEEEVILRQLDSRGMRLASLRRERASGYLYDLTTSTPTSP